MDNQPSQAVAPDLVTGWASLIHCSLVEYLGWLSVAISGSCHANAVPRDSVSLLRLFVPINVLFSTWSVLLYGLPVIGGFVG